MIAPGDIYAPVKGYLRTGAWPSLDDDTVVEEINTSLRTVALVLGQTQDNAGNLWHVLLVNGKLGYVWDAVFVMRWRRVENA